MALNTTNPASEVVIGPLVIQTTLATSTVGVPLAAAVSGNLVRVYTTVMDTTATAAWTTTVAIGTSTVGVPGSTMSFTAGVSTRGGVATGICTPTRVNQGDVINFISGGETTSSGRIISYSAVIRT